MKTNLLDTTAQASKPGPKESQLILEELDALEIEPFPEDLVNHETEIEILDSDNLGVEDPTRLYLRQIGRIPLLNIADFSSDCRSNTSARLRSLTSLPTAKISAGFPSFPNMKT
jgi:hypothetical protein